MNEVRAQLSSIAQTAAETHDMFGYIMGLSDEEIASIIAQGVATRMVNQVGAGVSFTPDDLPRRVRLHLGLDLRQEFRPNKDFFEALDEASLKGLAGELLGRAPTPTSSPTCRARRWRQRSPSASTPPASRPIARSRVAFKLNAWLPSYL